MDFENRTDSVSRESSELLLELLIFIFFEICSLFLMVQLMKTGELYKGKMVKREVDDVLEEDHSSLNKRSKQSSFLHVCSFSVSVLP